MFGLSKLKDPKFKIKKTSFVVSKLPPMQGLELAEYLRYHLAKSADSFTINDNASEKENAMLFFKAVIGMKPEVVANIREKLFEHVQFSGNGVEKGYMDLTGAEDMAFQGFEISDIYQVLGRALFINFFGSFAGIASAFPGAESFLKSQLQKT